MGRSGISLSAIELDQAVLLGYARRWLRRTQFAGVAAVLTLLLRHELPSSPRKLPYDALFANSRSRRAAEILLNLISFSSLAFKMIQIRARLVAPSLFTAPQALLFGAWYKERVVFRSYITEVREGKAIAEPCEKI